VPSRAAAVTAAIGDPVRLRLLQELMAGPAAVSELVRRLKAGQSNVSNHLSLLRAAALVVSRRRGRLIEYALAGPAVAQLVEVLSSLAGPPPAARRAELAEARTCYDHLAGRLGVALGRLPRSRRRFAFRCLDWTERRPHLGGALGAEVARAFERQGWTRRRPRSRRLDAAPRAWRALTASGA